MPSCQSCGKHLKAWMSRPIRCSCGNIFDDGKNPSPVPVSHYEPPGIRETPLSHWLEIHRYPADHIDDWSPDLARQHYADWKSRIPSGCGCSGRWADYESKEPPTFKDPLEYFTWGYRAHDYVSEFHSHKPRITFDRAKEIFWPNSETGVHVLTTLSPENYERQSECIKSWKHFGMKVVAQNTGREISILADQFPLVDCWISQDRVCIDENGRELQSLRAMCNSASMLNGALLANSDCELRGPPVELGGQKTLSAIVRHNYSQDWLVDSKLEKFGIDAFWVSPEVSRLVSEDCPFSIGVPGWDYYLPIVAQKNNYKVELIETKTLFHKRHFLNWGSRERERAFDLLRKELGYHPGSAWRESLRNG